MSFLQRDESMPACQMPSQENVAKDVKIMNVYLEERDAYVVKVKKKKKRYFRYLDRDSEEGAEYEDVLIIEYDYVPYNNGGEPA